MRATVTNLYHSRKLRHHTLDLRRVEQAFQCLLRLRELSRATRQLPAARARMALVDPSGAVGASKAIDAAYVSVARSQRALRFELLRSLCFLPPAIHYTLRPGSRAFALIDPWLPRWLREGLCLGEAVAGYVMLIEGLSCSRPNLGPIERFTENVHGDEKDGGGGESRSAGSRSTKEENDSSRVQDVRGWVLASSE
jgi:hypothetical protein